MALAQIDALIESWASFGPSFLWAPTTRDTYLLDRAKGVKGRPLGLAQSLGPGGMPRVVANSADSYITFPTAAGVVGGNNPMIGVMLIEVSDPAAVTGCMLKIGNGSTGLGYGAGATTFDSGGGSIVALQEAVAWISGGGSAFVRGVNVLVFGVATGTSANILLNPTTGVAATNGGAASNIAPSSVLQINGYTTSRGSNARVGAVAIFAGTNYTNERAAALVAPALALVRRRNLAQLFEARRVWVPVSAAGGATPLTLADAAHAHTADSLALTTSTSLTIADASHAHSADSLTLTSSTALVVAEASHAHTADSLTLSTAAVLAVADASHAHAADSLTLTSSSALAVADATHAHSADNLALSTTGSANLSVNDATHAHAADSLVLTSASSLAVADALHAHAADNVTLSPAGVASLTVADATHAHAADGLDLSTSTAVAIADALHGHTAGGLALTVDAWLAANNAAHGHTAGNLTIIASGGTAAAADVWSFVLANNKTAAQTLIENNEMLRIVMAAVAGTSAGVGTDTETYFGTDGTPRVIATFDAQGNRTSVAVDGAP